MVQTSWRIIVVVSKSQLQDGERKFFIYPVESRGNLAGKFSGENRGEISLGNFAVKIAGKNRREKSRGKIAGKKSGKIAGKNRGGKSRGKSNHFWAAGTAGAWAPDQNKKKLNVGTFVV
jgi:hypothetical protein